ncbi:MAG TPA: hypothetical protein VFH78_15655 [Candidatus Thermoplasmatota archaeon]|nr:hypothetical protein [Candidatus Thermoplasmatota archaeon]
MRAALLILPLILAGCASAPGATVEGEYARVEFIDGWARADGDQASVGVVLALTGMKDARGTVLGAVEVRTASGSLDLNAMHPERLFEYPGIQNGERSEVTIERVVTTGGTALSPWKALTVTVAHDGEYELERLEEVHVPLPRGFPRTP